MEQKVVITDSELTINDYLNQGWKVKYVTSQYVSTGGNGHLRGNFCFVLERY